MFFADGIDMDELCLGETGKKIQILEKWIIDKNKIISQDNDEY